MIARGPLEKIVLFGASGFLGRNFLHFWRDLPFEVIAVTRDAHPQSWLKDLHPQARHFSLTDFSEVASLRSLLDGKTGVVSAAANISYKNADPNFDSVQMINSVFPGDLARLCRDRKSAFIHISTDGLYSNKEPGEAPRYFTVDSSINPINAYAQTKAAGEAAVKAANWGSVFRVSFVGSDRGTGKGLVAFLARAFLETPEKVPGFVDNWFTPLHVSQLSEATLRKLNEFSGDFSIDHIATDRAISKFEFLREVACRANLHVGMVEVERKSQVAMNPAPLDQSLKNSYPIEFSTDAMLNACAADLKILSKA